MEQESRGDYPDAFKWIGEIWELLRLQWMIPCSNKQESLQEKEIDERRKENKDEEAYAIQIGETTGIQHFQLLPKK